MTELPLVSVYITNHNYGKYIAQAIESVLQQSMGDFEVIIIDDGSTDNSREIIEEYATDPKVRVIFQKNKGLNVTNNIAMRAASGKYIMRLDADDFLDTNALLVMSNALEKDNELGLVFPDYYMVDEGGEIQTIEKRLDFAKEVTLLDQPAHGACTMIRRSFLMKLNGYDESYECQDGYELWVKFIDHYKVNNISTPLFYYRQHGNNLTSNEKKILTTRAKIKENFVKKRQEQLPPTLAIVPVRDYKNAKQYLPFHSLEGEYLIDWKIKQALASQHISKVVITSSDLEIGSHISDQYSDEPRVSFIERDIKMARMNIDLTATIDHILEQSEILTLSPELVVILALEFPFIAGKTIDDAIHTQVIFGADSLIGVRPETSLFFQHDGEGMKAILNQDKFTKLEREALFRYTGGVSVTNLSYFKKHRKTLGGKVGHIVIDQTGAHSIKTALDLEIAEYLAKGVKNKRTT